MDKEHGALERAPRLADLFADLSPKELKEAEERLDRYLTLALAIYTRIAEDKRTANNADAVRE